MWQIISYIAIYLFGGYCFNSRFRRWMNHHILFWWWYRKHPSKPIKKTAKSAKVEEFEIVNLKKARTGDLLSELNERGQVGGRIGR
jgi:hypothetical protein